MPNCARCANPVSPSDRFCPHCGHAAAAFDASDAPTVTPSRAPSRPASDPSSLGHGRFEPGTRLGARYRIVGLLGRGGMGEVYRADDLELGQSVALKFLPERLRHDAETLARFRGEVRLARAIAHPNVARVYDIGEADGHVFLTMEYVDGEDLGSVLRRMGRPSRDKAVEIARQLCLGLAAAHERGVLHRDLKPSNVMIDGRGRVRVMDFGLAALADETVGDNPIVGTPAYMAPEQFASGTVSVQSDLYALGLVLYELFTGRRGHEASSPAELSRRHASSSVPLPSSVVDDMDPVVERVVLRCLESDPGLRPPSAVAVFGALPGGDPLAAALAAGETPSPDLVAHAGESGGIAPWIAGTLLAVVLACAVAAMTLMAPIYRNLPQSPEALAFKSASTLEALGYAQLPRHSAAGFELRDAWLDRLHQRHVPLDSLAAAGPGAMFFWRRFAAGKLDPVGIHQSVPRLADPPPTGTGSIAVLLTPEGNLLGLQALVATDSAGVARADTVRAVRAAPWAPLFALAALDTSRLVADRARWSSPVASDTAASWTLASPRPGGGTWHVRAAAYGGRAVYFAIADSLGSANAQLERPPLSGTRSVAEWVGFLTWAAQCLGGLVLARRNLQLGRGDRRGAFRLAAFVFVATVLESVFTWSVPENGFVDLVDSLLSGRAFGHALIHGSQMWIAYVAIEPYVRRLWPRMLVSWARLASGRPRDPMVGRDVLVGLALGGIGSVTVLMGGTLLAMLKLPSLPHAIDPTSLAALSSAGGVFYGVSYNLSIMVLGVLETLVVCLLLHLVTRNDRATFVVAGAIATAWAFGQQMSPGQPPPILESVVPTVVMFVALFRFGLLTALAAQFALNVLPLVPPVFDGGAWYGTRGLLVLGPVVALLAFSAWTALAGQPLVADVLQERKVTRG